MVEHDLNAEELARFIELTPKGKSRWRQARCTVGRFSECLYEPVVEHDGREITVASCRDPLICPSWDKARCIPVTPAMIIRSVFQAHLSMHEWRVEAAKRQLRRKPSGSGTRSALHGRRI
jgi:hypothetical protein